jgi:hypothetical protein
MEWILLSSCLPQKTTKLNKIDFYILMEKAEQRMLHRVTRWLCETMAQPIFVHINMYLLLYKENVPPELEQGTYVIQTDQRKQLQEANNSPIWSPFWWISKFTKINQN